MTSHDHGNPRLCRAERRPSSFMSKGHLQGKGSKQCRQRGRIIRAQIKPATPRAGSAPSLNGKDPSPTEQLTLECDTADDTESSDNKNNRMRTS